MEGMSVGSGEFFHCAQEIFFSREKKVIESFY